MSVSIRVNSRFDSPQLVCPAWRAGFFSGRRDVIRFPMGRMTGCVETPEAMVELGRAAALEAEAGSVIALVGGLGAGKTHWTKGFVAGMGSRAEVTSPTFGLVHEYPGGRLPVFHFDFYRLDEAEELIAIGWDEYLEAGGVLIAEWADKFPGLLPENTKCWVFSIHEDGSRSVRCGEL